MPRYDRLIPGTWIVSYIFSYHFYTYIPVSENRPTLFLATPSLYFPVPCAWRIHVDFIHSVYLFFSRRSSARQLFYHRADVNVRGPKRKTRRVYLRIILNNVRAKGGGRGHLFARTKYFSYYLRIKNEPTSFPHARHVFVRNEANKI